MGLPGWLKDFYIYYELEGTFQEFVEKNKLEEWYPDLTNPQEGFDLLCSISKYDLRSSALQQILKMFLSLWLKSETARSEKRALP